MQKKIVDNNALKRLLGALRSRHPAAYLALFIKTAAPLTRCMDYFISFFCQNRNDKQFNLKKCLMIVCPPRSGGTVIYQALTSATPCVHLTNLHALFPRTGHRVIQKWHNHFDKANLFNNYYGYTSHLWDVYEGNEFLEWAHKPMNLCKTERNKFLELISLLNPDDDQCVILKNARAYDVVGKLHQAIPEMVFVRVRRDRCQVVQSVIRAFHELGYFHPVPSALKDKPIGDPVEFAVTQIEMIEEKLDYQFSSLPLESKIEISYEQFCRNPYEFINRLAYEKLGLPQGAVREVEVLNQLKPSQRRKVSNEERLQIEHLLKDRSFHSDKTLP